MATIDNTRDRHLGEVVADVKHSRRVLEDSRRERLALEAQLRSSGSALRQSSRRRGRLFGLLRIAR